MIPASPRNDPKGRWSEQAKGGVPAESLEEETRISAVARRHGLHPNQLFGWRRQFRTGPTGAEPGSGGGGFIPVELSDAAQASSAPVTSGPIDILVGGLTTVRVSNPVDAEALRGVLDVARRLA